MIKKVILTILSVMCVSLAVVCGVYAANMVVEPFNPAYTEDGVAIKTDKALGDRVNVLIIGTDEGGGRSDTILLASIDVKTKQVSILSIPRDTRVNIKGRYDKINHTLSYPGKEDSVIEAVKIVTGLPVNYYVTVDLQGFRNIIDILGGVYIDVPQNMRYTDPAQGLYIDLKAGYQLLDGKKAEQFVRYRKYTNGDIGRVHAQQSFVSELVKQKLTLQNIAKADEIFAEVKKYVKTNYGISDFLSHMDIIKGINTETLFQADLPHVPQTIDGISYVIYNEAETKQLIQDHFVTKNESVTEQSNESE